MIDNEKRELLEQRLWEMQLLVDQMIETSEAIGFFVARLRGNPNPSRKDIEDLPNEILDDESGSSDERKRLIMTSVMLRSYATHVRMAYLSCLEILTGNE